MVPTAAPPPPPAPQIGLPAFFAAPPEPHILTILEKVLFAVNVYSPGVAITRLPSVANVHWEAPDIGGEIVKSVLTTDLKFEPRRLVPLMSMIDPCYCVGNACVGGVKFVV